MKLSCVGLLLFSLVAAFDGPKAETSDQYPPPSGQRHPDLILPSIADGTALALSHFAGQRVLLLHFTTATAVSRDAVVAWHEKTAPLVKEHKLAILGVCHDRSPAYARLFMQWKQIDWPVAHDLLNHPGLDHLPLVLYISEKGIVKQIDPEPDKLVKKLAKSKALQPREIPAEDRAQLPEAKVTRRAATEGRTADAHCAHANALVLAAAPAQVEEAITHYTEATKLEADNVGAWFGLGVAHVLHKTQGGSSESGDDDAKAVEKSWKKVRELAAENEVYKIEIQQFRANRKDMDAMFGWVKDAHKAITDRGEKPVEVP